MAHILDRGLICHRVCREVEAMDTMEAKIIKFIQIAYQEAQFDHQDVSSVMKQSEKLVHTVQFNLSSPCSQQSVIDSSALKNERKL